MSGVYAYRGRGGHWFLTSPNPGGFPVPLHRLIYRRHKGPIPRGYVVHHLDHDPGNNRPSNLHACSPADNQRFEHPDVWRKPLGLMGPWERKCAGCGEWKRGDAYSRRNKKGAWNSRCRPCAAALARERRGTRPRKKPAFYEFERGTVTT